jgi:hypothetical protein
MNLNLPFPTFITCWSCARHPTIAPCTLSASGLWSFIKRLTAAAVLIKSRSPDLHQTVTINPDMLLRAPPISPCTPDLFLFLLFFVRTGLGFRPRTANHTPLLSSLHPLFTYLHFYYYLFYLIIVI